MRNVRRQRAALRLVVAGGALLTVAAGMANAQETHVSLGLPNNYQTLDFMAYAIPTALGYSFPGYDRLVGFSADKSELVPYLAESWEQSPAGRPVRTTFKLRQDAQCPDGSYITPEVVANSMQRFIDVPKVSNKLPNLFGPGPYSIEYDNESGTVTWDSGVPFVNTLFGFAQTGIICPAGLKALESDPDALTKGQYGSGPYEFVGARTGVEVSWKKREEWSWGPEGTDLALLPDRLTYRIITDNTTIANLLTTGELDLGVVSGPDIRRLEAMGQVKTITVPSTGVLRMGLNQQPGRITADLAVRDAIARVFNPDDLIAAAGATGNVDASYISPITQCYRPDMGTRLPGYDIAAARAALEAAGYSPGADGVMVKDGARARLVVVANAVFGSMGEYFATELQEAGFEVVLETLSQSDASARWPRQDWDIFFSQALGFDGQQAFQIANVSGNPPPEGTNSGWTGRGDDIYMQSALDAVASTSCGPIHAVIDRMLDNRYMLPIGFLNVYNFGSPAWDFPPVLNNMEVIWLRPAQ